MKMRLNMSDKDMKMSIVKIKKCNKWYMTAYLPVSRHRPGPRRPWPAPARRRATASPGTAAPADGSRCLNGQKKMFFSALKNKRSYKWIKNKISVDKHAIFVASNDVK